MKNININQSIQALSSASRYGILVATAMMLGKICWWLANPSGYDSITNIRASLNVKTPGAVAIAIVNRAPFGVTQIEKVKHASILDQVKVVGIYAAGRDSSIALLEVEGKSRIAMIGDSIAGAKLTLITPQGITVLSESQNINLTLSKSSDNGTAGSNNDYRTNNPATLQNHQTEPAASDDSITEKRRKMIENFQKQYTNNDNQASN